jgi:hypothetical protein
MKRWFAIALFVAALVALLVAGQLEKRRSKQALQSAITSVNAQLEHENSGTTTPANRTEFLKRQRKLLGAMQGVGGAPPVSPAPKAPTTTAPTAPTAAAPAPSLPAAAYMPFIITGVFGLASLWIILSKGYKLDEEARKWAFGTLGLIVGYWLKG